MKRLFGAVVIGLALTIPVTVAPVTAHVSVFWPVVWTSVLDDKGETISGFVINHLGPRQTDIEITATWKDGDAVMETITVPAMVGNLAAHAFSPFMIFNPTPVEADWSVTVDVTSSTSTVDVPVGGLLVKGGEFIGGGVYQGLVTNDGSVPATSVRVYGYRTQGANSASDSAVSDLIDSIAPGETVAYSITFDETRPGEFVRLVAQTTEGPLLTSWNNFFGDLGSSKDSFVTAIGWMGAQGITTGCGSANFCPKEAVTRAQMALFLSRALGLDDTTPVGFTDVGGLSQAVQDLINAAANAGITAGCGTAPLRYCPSSLVTRGQMSKFLVTGYGTVAGNGLVPVEHPDVYVDDNGHFSEPYNNAMGLSGITSGCATSHYCPQVIVTREQMAIYMMRASELSPAP
jgi:hypothetical protein